MWTIILIIKQYKYNLKSFVMQGKINSLMIFKNILQKPMQFVTFCINKRAYA